MKHYTTKRQSYLLMELGIPEETADMVYENTGWVSLDYPTIRTNEKIGGNTPCWTTGQLLDVYRAVRKFLTGKYYNLRVLQEDEINCDTIIEELEKAYNHIHTHYDCSKENIRDWYDFSKITL